MLRVLVISVLIVFLHKTNSISITHHDKPDETKLSDMEMPKEEEIETNNTEAVNERQRRLIPYMTFYLTHNYNRPQQQHQYQQYVPHKIQQVQPVYQNKYILPNFQPKYAEPQQVVYRPKITYTPFLNSNKLPGRFSPMVRTQSIQIPQPDRPHYQLQVTNEPNFSTIFDKLLQMKQVQDKPPQYTVVPHYQTNPKLNTAAQYFTNEYVTRRPPPPKYVQVENYQDTVPEQRYKEVPTQVNTIIHTYTPSNIEIPTENKIQNYDNFESLKIYNQISSPVKLPPKNVQPVIPEEYRELTVQDVPEKNYETYILRPIAKPLPQPVTSFRPYYRPIQYTTTPQPAYIPTENPHSLSVILKQLQDSNTLPQTLTADNIDNSIKTLVNILNSLKHNKLQRPIVVDDISEQQEEEVPEEEDDPITVNENFPANTPEGGTPGKPGLDYPAYSKIPHTSFDCKTQRYKGFFGDPDTNCQVWHYCDLNGGQASFLCPNGTIFSQVALTCDWWYNVKCATTTQLYVLNERLYKYILPFTPKFPEDYSGPLVDKYLALKFKEMEEKMRKQKKGKIQKPADDTQEGDVDKLQIIEAETVTKLYVTESSEETKK